MKLPTASYPAAVVRLRGAVILPFATDGPIQ